MSSLADAWAGVEITPVSALAESRGDWSDDIPLNTAKNHPFADPCSNPKWIAAFAIEWYNLYYGDIVPQDQSFLDMIAKAMSCACIPIRNDVLVSAWTSISAQPSWYKYNVILEEPMIDISAVSSTQLSDEYLKKVRIIQKDEEIQSNYVYSTDETHERFREAYNQLIKKIEDDRDIDSMFRICNMIAYMGTMTLRCLTKDEHQMGAGSLKVNFQENLRKLSLLNDFCEIPAPHSRYVHRATKLLVKSAKISKVLLAHCLSLFISEEVPHHYGKSTDGAKALVKAAALTHLEHTGMAVCSLYVRALRALPADAQDLANDLECSALKPSLLILGRTFQRYGTESKTWWWARAYDDGFLLELTWKNHQMLVTVLSAMLKKKKPLENAGIMASVAVSTLGEDDRFRAEAFAEAVLETCYAFEVKSKNAEINRVFKEKTRQRSEEERTAEAQMEITNAEDKLAIARLQESLVKRKRDPVIEVPKIGLEMVTHQPTKPSVQPEVL